MHGSATERCLIVDRLPQYSAVVLKFCHYKEKNDHEWKSLQCLQITETDIHRQSLIYYSAVINFVYIGLIVS